MPARRPWWILTVVLSSCALLSFVHTAAAQEGTAASAEEPGPPALLSPLPGVKLGFANPVFYWAPVEGAASYLVELCKDESCGPPLDRATVDASQLGNEPHWRPKTLVIGTYYWRVTARSRSGVDGPPAGGKLEILSDQVDHEPPMAKLALSGLQQAQVGGRLFTSSAPAFEVDARDDGCGLYMASPLFEGSLDTPGDHTLHGYAIDRCGNRVDLTPITFTVDTEAPTVRSEVVDAAGRQGKAPAGPGLYGSVDGRRWRPLWRPSSATPATPASTETKAKKSAKPAPQKAEVAGDHPPLFLLARGVKLTIDGRTVEPGAGKLVAVNAEDAGAGVGKLRLHVKADGGTPALEIEAVDKVGNRRAVSWPLAVP